jgi:hypothetical protein
MSSITDLIQQHLGNDGIAQLSQHLGVDPATAQAAAAAALPALVGAMGQQQGTAMPTAGAATAGGLGGVLGSLFGGNHTEAAQQVSKHSGLDIHTAEKALLFLAPIVMARLQQQRQAGAAAPATPTTAGTTPVQGQPAAPVEGEQSGLGSVLGAVERMFHKGS